MDLGIGRILELLQHQVARIGCHQFFRFPDCPNHAVATWRQHQFRTIGPQQHAPFLAHRFRHRQYATIATRRAHHCHRNTGVAAGRLDKNGVWSDFARLFCSINHCHADTVFHAMRRAIEFELGDDIGDGIGCKIANTYQRCIADQLRYVIYDFHDGPFPPVDRAFAVNESLELHTAFCLHKKQ